MKKLLMIILGIALVGVTFAFPPWMAYQTQTTENMDINPYNILKDVNISEYTTPTGYKIYNLIKNGEVVGVLWDNINLSKVTIGNPFYTWWGVRYPIYYNGYLVGYISDYNYYNKGYCGYPPRGWRGGPGCCCGCPCCWGYQ